MLAENNALMNWRGINSKANSFLEVCLNAIWDSTNQKAHAIIMSSIISIRSEGIYHGLPQLPPNTKGLKAIVAGASGLSGEHMMEVLGGSPERWEKVYAVSRRPPVTASSSIHHVSVDLLLPPEKIATTFQDAGVQA